MMHPTRSTITVVCSLTGLMSPRMQEAKGAGTVEAAAGSLPGAHSLSMMAGLLYRKVLPT